MRKDLGLLYLPNPSECYPLADDRAQDLIEQLTQALGEPPFVWDDDGGCNSQAAVWEAFRQTDITKQEIARLWLWVGARSLLIASQGEDCGHG